MDYKVLASQTWLNQTYGGRSGYISAPENGNTGWSTMYSATRALQLELGITSTSDSFGPGTFAELTNQVGSLNSSTAPSYANIVGILQCAMWCKGYWGGDEFGVWDPDVSAWVLQIRADMGLTASASVSPKLFKSLLTMDAYVRVGDGTEKVRGIQRWMNGKYVGHADFDLIPCDGIYSRQVQQGLMYGLQFEIGMVDGQANGNFGPGTQQGVRDFGIFGIGAVDGPRAMVSIYQAALVFNGYDSAPFSGSFDATTAAQTSAFQSFVELPSTGSANFSTWASLLVSTGDRDRATSTCDTSTPIDSTNLPTLYGAGYRTVGRYINGTQKRLQPGEAARIWSAGMTWFPIYQEWNDSAEHFSYALGHEQGQRIAMRMRQMGIKTGNRVYLSVDFDATEDDIYAVVIPHFQGVRDALNASKWVAYRLGVYGTRNVCTVLADEGLSESSFVSDMSTGYSGNLGFRLPGNWAYDQIDERDIGSGLGIDKVVASTRSERLTSSSMVRTPRATSTEDTLVFDEAFYWRLAGLGYLGDAASDNAAVSQSARNNLVLNWMQKPKYWSGPDTGELGTVWATAFTPSLASTHPANSPVRLALDQAGIHIESVAGGELYPRPGDGRFGDTMHWAATTRGHLHWGMPTNPSEMSFGDLGGWALDMATFWMDYEAARVASPGGVLDVQKWVSANLGQNEDTHLGTADLRADMAAFLCAKRMSDEPLRALDDIAREMLLSIEDDPGWLAKRFIAERFGSRSNMVAAAKSVFTTLWLPNAARGLFVKTREPGEQATTLPVSSGVLATELDGLANGFADAVQAAQQWEAL